MTALWACAFGVELFDNCEEAEFLPMAVENSA